MKKILFILGLFLTVSNFTKAQIIKNPDFEIINNDSVIKAESWSTKSNSENVHIDSLVAYSGKNSLTIKSDKITDYKVEQCLQVSNKDFSKFLLSAYIKTDSIQFGSGYLSLYTVNNKGKYGFISKSVQLTGTNDWEKYTIEFYVDSTIKEIIVGGRLNGKGQIWFDDFSIKSISIGKPKFSDKVLVYLNEVFKIIEENSMRKDSLDLQGLKELCLKNLEAQTEADCYPMIRYIVGKLSDNHSSFEIPNEASSYQKETQIKFPIGKIIDKNYAYLAIYSFLSTDSITQINYATKLQSMIDSLNKYSPIGWIIDLRENSGGNCWPMIAGMGPLIGEGDLCYIVDNKNNRFTFSYKNGTSLINNEAIVKIQGEPLFLNIIKPLAVLIGPYTASSGEILAISFIGKPNVKLFGEPSYGVTTANAPFTLSDGAIINLTVGVDLDRNFKKYGDKIIPDFRVNFSNLKYEENDDPVIFQAKEWILGNN
ncbi:MAG: S41 family peptidase [Ignavibacteriales bacterium]|nr:S41 family peptidase [Ignavibacteriales bacterium]